ncbi:uncharacterized protein LOC118713373 [Pipistrellus kuhlii]|uniref:Uncharacterized protein n=1 Tax=Pipistrellus kuhlii TaxID=59472 RepID=A0A7J7WZY6_PIPKU|nr:uncharacterized protein LOC118713373 [Pipistrellus kuhlii]XP_045433634.1 uncharacterized protein LOC118713373 [Pipistrellus kuhlii]KAF6342993.1 hypothetical protein mPipKuh1_010724 [Pipistrellus kuhlii]
MGGVFGLSQVPSVGKGAPVHLTADPLHSASPPRGSTNKTPVVWPRRHGASYPTGRPTAAPRHQMCWNVVGCFRGWGAPWAWERTGRARGLSSRGWKGRGRSRPQGSCAGSVSSSRGVPASRLWSGCQPHLRESPGGNPGSPAQGEVSGLFCFALFCLSQSLLEAFVTFLTGGWSLLSPSRLLLGPWAGASAFLLLPHGPRAELPPLGGRSLLRAVGIGAPSASSGCPREGAGREEPPSPSCSFPSLRQSQSELPPPPIFGKREPRAERTSGLISLPGPSSLTLLTRQNRTLCPSFSVASSRKPARLSRGLRWSPPTLSSALASQSTVGLKELKPEWAWSSAYFPPRATLTALPPEPPGFSLPHGNRGR